MGMNKKRHVGGSIGQSWANLALIWYSPGFSKRNKKTRNLEDWWRKGLQWTILGLFWVAFWATLGHFNSGHAKPCNCIHQYHHHPNHGYLWTGWKGKRSLTGFHLSHVTSTAWVSAFLNTCHHCFDIIIIVVTIKIILVSTVSTWFLWLSSSQDYPQLLWFGVNPGLIASLSNTIRPVWTVASGSII